MLFRQEVLAAKMQPDKAIALKPPKVGWALFTAGFSVVALLLAFLWFFHYSQHAKAFGYLVPDLGATSVVAQSDALVTRVLVSEGSSVESGDALVEISQEQESLHRGGVYADASRQLLAKRSLLEADLRHGKIEADRKKNAIKSRIALIEGQQTEIIRQIALERDPTNAARELYAQWRKNADRGFVSKIQLLQQQDVVLQHETKTRSLEQQRLSLLQGINDARSELDVVGSDAERSYRDTERQLADDADIVLDSRRLIEWVFEPIYGVRNAMTNTEEATDHG